MVPWLSAVRGDLGREINTSFYAVNNITYSSPHFLLSRAIADLKGANSDCSIKAFGLPLYYRSGS
jgi:hypothetical protein